MFHFRDPQKDVLKINLKDDDYLSADDDIGTAMYSINALKEKELVDLDLELEGTHGRGRVYMTAKYIRFQGR